MQADSILTITHVEEIDLSGEETKLVYKVTIQSIFGKYFVMVYRKHDDGWGLSVNVVTTLETFNKEEAEREFKYRCALYRGEV